MDHAPPRPLWGTLTPGPFGVGYGNRVVYDHSRLYDRAWSVDGKPSPKRFRPLSLHLWYPAEQLRDDVSPMPLREYWDIEPVEAPQTSFLSRVVQHNRNGLAEGFFKKRYHDLAEGERDTLERFLDTPTFSHRNAPYAPGRFPLVVSHGGLGSSYDDNTVLFEYLASRGYVVASSAFQSENAAFPSIDWDLDRSVKDLDRLLNVLAEEPNVDLERVGVIGQSYGAQAALAYGSEVNSPVDAVVSLDSTLEYANGDYSGFKPLMDRLGWDDRLTVPTLLFARAAASPDFSPFASHRYTERYYALVEDIGHNDFASGGVFCSPHDPQRPADLPPPERVRAAYDAVCRLVLLFLDAVLKEDPSARARLEEMVARGGNGPITLNYEPAEPPLPTPKQLIDRALERGVSAAIEWSRGQPVQIAEWGLIETARGLNRSGHPAEAVALMEHCVRIRPESATAWSFLGDVYGSAGQERESLGAYRRSLSLLPGEESRDNWQKWLGSRGQTEIERLEEKFGNPGEK